MAAAIPPASSQSVAPLAPPKVVSSIGELPPLRKPTPAKPKKAARPKAPPKSKVQGPTLSAPSAVRKPNPRKKRPSTAQTQAPLPSITPVPTSDAVIPESERDPLGLCQRSDLLHKNAEAASVTSGIVTSEYASSPPPLVFKAASSTLADQANKPVRFDASQSPVTPIPVPIPAPMPAQQPSAPTAEHSAHVKGKAKKVGTSTFTSTNLRPIVTQSQPVEIDGDEAGKEDNEVCKQRMEQQRLMALENLIIDKIHDEEFCRLLCDVGRVWQRIGFEKVLQESKLFDIGNI
ncbi:hypothetical protein BDZ91DRAFT_746923 [Kalaharituber pfeilii]|nr:hypothetical protein BDZ91DRAFT_746923 [Kalaharituber pfeilii]